jgi:hypothetical protein
MLDAMSYINCPDEFTIKSLLLQDLLKHFVPPSLDLDNKTVYYKQVIDQMFDRFGGMKTIGSLAGWTVYSRPQLIKMCIEHIDTRDISNYVNIEINTNIL